MQPSQTLDLIVVPRGDPPMVARALAGAAGAEPDLIALILDEDHARVSVVRFVDQGGQPIAVDLAPYARALSAAGRSAGVAHIDPTRDTRSWDAWADGAQTRTIGLVDELYVPFDADGMPDLDATPVARPDGAGAGWRRLRSCLDMGMELLASCRFTPVAHALDAMAMGEGDSVHAFVLRRGGQAVQPPAEVPWRRLPDAD